jgi:DNA-binding NarL/FixJ family response regulator
VEQVGKGCIWAGKQETALLLEAFRSIPAPALVTSIDSPALTTRELEVARCAAKGKTNKAIAMELGLSEHTVKNYLFRAFEKLGVSSRVELLFYLTTRGHTFSGSRSNGSDNV